MWERDVYQDTALPADYVWLFIVATAIVFLGIIVLAFVRMRRRNELAAAAEASVGDTPPALAEGASVVLSGAVRHHEQDVAVRVSITQSGSQRTYRGSTSHSWKEIAREVTVAPFMLDLPSGESVLVSPPKNVELADALDHKQQEHRYERTWTAELTPGEKIFARGRLQRSDVANPAAAYRDVKWGWELQPADGKMLLSSEPMGAGLRARAAFHRNMGLLAIGSLVALLLTLVPFFARWAVGATEVANVQDLHTWVTHNRNSTTTHYGVNFEAPVIGYQSVEVDRDDWDYYGGFEGQVTVASTPVLVASSTNWQLGARPTIRYWHALILVGCAIAFGIWYRVRRQMTRPWFRRKLNENGSGPLPEPDVYAG